MKKVIYRYFDGDSIDDKILKDCSKLYSENYGIWGAKAKNEGNRVKLSEKAIRSWLTGRSWET